MKLNTFRFMTIIMIFTCIMATLSFGASASKKSQMNKNGYSPAMQKKIKEMQTKIDQYAKDEAAVKKNLQTFDTLDFVVFSNQEWVRLHESHSMDVVVNWPDGHHTNGIQRHIEDLKAMFVYAPDTQIKLHATRFGVYRGATTSAMDTTGKIDVTSKDSGDGFTCVTGIMTGTFSEPMPIGDGKFIQPTGKKFSIPMCTVGHWEKGVMTEEWLYWDNATYMKQIGIGQ